ncbi:hypothetical protein T440DRAFT_478757 [Plenodomus tracheiphilus IPT5]|uniref:Uncharacterized protein n=1 Tax=Plenodomus tracheiphilus IPT5 TaxID=1408161 RepID=A0A6A7B987_9PLEO|nr:hypothetical protein T440DRAFT_478757 [Plenodomus tracheiphilus IPT5]
MPRRRSRSQVRFASRDEYEPTRGRSQYRRPSPESRESSYSPSRSRSRSRSQTREVEHYRHQPPPLPSITATVRDDKKDKEWYHKKTLWTGLATVATVAALLPSTISAKASVDAAHASGRAARASEKSALQVTKSARASEISAMGSIMSARAVTNSCLAQGHMDEYGNAIRKNGYGEVERLQVKHPLVGAYPQRGGTLRRN